MSTEENKAIVTRHLKEVLEQGRVELIDSCFAPKQGSDSHWGSAADWRNLVLGFHQTSPGFKVNILQMTAEEDRVVVDIRFELTYSVPIDPPPSNFPAFGVPVSWLNLNFFRIVDGKIVETHESSGWTDAVIASGASPYPDVDQNKAIARRFLEEAWNQGKVEVIDEIYTPDGSDPEMDSPETVKGNMTFFHKYAPGVKFTILDLLAEGDTVMTYWQVDVTYSIPADPPPDEFFLPFGKPVSWKGVDILRIVGGKIVAKQHANPWSDTLVKIGVIPLDKIVQNKAAVRRFVDAVNGRDNALLAEICTVEEAKNWIDMLPGAYAMWKDHHIELVDIVADGETVAVKMATSGYHSGEAYGIPATGIWWTNNGNCLFYFSDGKISKTDFLFDDQNLIKQLGGVIRPAA